MQDQKTTTSSKADAPEPQAEGWEARQARLAGKGGKPMAKEGRDDRAARGGVAQALGEAVEGMVKAHLGAMPHKGRADKIPTPVQIKRNLGPQPSGAVGVYGELRQPVAPDFLGHWITDDGLLPLALEVKSAQDIHEHARRWAIPDKLRIYSQDLPTHTDGPRALGGLVGGGGMVGRQDGRGGDGSEVKRRAAVRAMLDKGAQRQDGHQGAYVEDVGRKGGVAGVVLYREATRALYLIPVHPEMEGLPSLRAASWAWEDLEAWRLPARRSLADALCGWRRYLREGWGGL